MLTKTIESMVEVFSTNVEDDRQASTLLQRLQRIFPHARITIDLEDCDKVLRLEGDDICPNKVVTLFRQSGFQCMALH